MFEPCLLQAREGCLGQPDVQAWPKSHPMQLNKGPQHWLAVGLQFEEQEGIKKGGSGFKGWCDLLSDYNGWEGMGTEKQCWLFACIKDRLSFFTTYSIGSSFNLGFIHFRSLNAVGPWFRIVLKNKRC